MSPIRLRPAPVNGARHRRAAVLGSTATGVVVGAIVFGLVSLSGFVLPGQSAHADESSAVTIKASDQDPDIASAPFPDLAVTVSQTTNLVSQGIRVSWTGGKKSTVPSGQNGGENFLQIAECWGDDPANPGQPDRTTCQYGAFGTPGAARDSFLSADAPLPAQDADYTIPSTNFAVPTYASIPFRAVTGEVVSSIKGGKHDESINVNTNQFFTNYTSNEIPWAGSGATGEGSAKFEVQTSLEAPGLGCGSPITAADNSISGRSCWLVLIPRATADPGEQHIVDSGLFWDSWKHRIAFRLGFKPLGVNCNIGAAERAVTGSELAAVAVASWQPKLCNAEGGAIYTLSTGSESDALTAAATDTTGGPLALTSRALTGSDGADPLKYAPIALTGVSIGFSVDRSPSAKDGTPADALAKVGLPFGAINLTPRLVAKLLTNSYLDSVPIHADRKELGYVSEANPGKNARNLTLDPDFLAVNDAEWANQSIISPSVADLLEPQGRSDTAWQLWSYVLSDPSAVDFLKGKPDPWGMIVNPWSSTVAANNASGNALTLPRDNFPKADPIEQAATASAGPVNLVTWRPYTNDLDQSAYLTLRGDGQTLGDWDPTANPPKYGKSVRNLPGQQKVLGLTDTASAARYQVISASLLNAAGKFVSPTAASLTAAAAVMTPNAKQPAVVSYDFASAGAKAATDAYPLAMPVYAAANPALSSGAVRTDYAAFIRFAATTGQVPGTAEGQLPDGYAPIPAAWSTQALAAAKDIMAGSAAPTTPTTPTGGTGGGTTTTGGDSGSGSTPVDGGTPVDTPSGTPTATGSTAAPLAASVTPKDPKMGAISAAVPLSLLAGFAAALAAPVISRIRRRP